MSDDENAGSEPAGPWSAKRTASAVLGLVLASAVFFAIRPPIRESNPCKSANPYDRGVALDLYGDRSAAIAAYTEDLKAKPEHVEALKNRGYDYAELGQLDAAAADLTLALQLQPHDWDLMDHRADVYLKLGQFDQAMADLTHAVQTDSDAWSTWYARGNAYMGHGDRDAARGRDCAVRGSNTGDCAIPYPPPSNPMVDKLIDAAGRSLSGCEHG